MLWASLRTLSRNNFKHSLLEKSRNNTRIIKIYNILGFNIYLKWSCVSIAGHFELSVAVENENIAGHDRWPATISTTVNKFVAPIISHWNIALDYSDRERQESFIFYRIYVFFWISDEIEIFMSIFLTRMTGQGAILADHCYSLETRIKT